LLDVLFKQLSKTDIPGMTSLDMLRCRVREDTERLQRQLAVIAALQEKGQSTEVAEMFARAYQKFLKQSIDDLAVAENEARIDHQRTRPRCLNRRSISAKPSERRTA
jgi:anionic cell wall polymer biosynthesis LytR-Cps2A-Psr (LCP) family protein